MFKKSREYAEILEEIKHCNILHKYAKFMCYSDNIFTYHLIFEDLKHEFNIIAESETFLDDMFVSELLDLKRVNYFEHTIYDNRDDSRLGSISFIRDINHN